jgi:hypothetical protein
MALYEITPNNLNKIEQTTFGQSGLYERGDLQRLFKKQIDVILPDILIVSEEFGEWDESRRRIDLLGIDREGNLVVIELKRTEDGGHMELQAIRYAAMVSTMTFEGVVAVYEKFLRNEGVREVDAKSRILEFLELDEPDEETFAQDVKILLISSNFSKELTTAVMWLNKRDLDISCVRVIPYQDNGRVLLDVQQIIPLPEVADYQIQIREKEQKERKDRKTKSTDQRMPKFWEGLLALELPKSNLTAKMSPSTKPWMGSIGCTRIDILLCRQPISQSRRGLYRWWWR